MYDLEIGIPFCKGYLQRLKDFKRLGLTNLGNHQIQVNLLIGNEKFSEDLLFEGWASGIDIRVQTCDSAHWIPKLAGYYLSINPDNARWFAKMDDDSITDVSALIHDLDFHFDEEREYYIATELHPTTQLWHNIDRDMVQQFGYGRWTENKYKTTLCNEWECSIVSRAAMQRLVSHPQFKPYLEKRRETPSGPGDVMLAMVARMCKIYLIEADFMTKNCAFPQMTRFGGRMSHIHYISRQSKPNLIELLLWHEENQQEMRLREKNGEPVVLTATGEIVTQHPVLQELFWYEKKDRIVLISGDGEIMDLLEKNGTTYRGKEFVLVPEEKAYLRM